MKYDVEYSQRAIKNLKKLDKRTRDVILAWVDENLDGCENPRTKGKGLTSNRSGEWRYRVEDYRIIADIQDGKLLVLVVEIGHRKKVYRN